MHEITIEGNTPSKSNQYKIITIKGRGSLAKSPALKKYEESFLWQCGNIRGKMIDEPFKIEIDVYYPSKRPDLDNALKVVLDCLQKAKAIKNDNLCAEIVARKFISKERPRVEIKLSVI